MNTAARAWLLAGLLLGAAAMPCVGAPVLPCHAEEAALLPQAPDPSARRYQNTAPRVAPSVTADSVARLEYPQGVQERARTTDRDDDELIKTLEHRLKCTCGCSLDVFTCRTTDFTCATSPAMHRLVLARLDSAMTPEQVVAAFEAQYGQAILMQPPKRGFNWTAYVMPFVGLGFGLALVTVLMRRWVARSKAGEAAGMKEKETAEFAETPSAIGHLPSVEDSDDHVLTPRDAELERLERELEKYED